MAYELLYHNDLDIKSWEKKFSKPVSNCKVVISEALMYAKWAKPAFTGQNWTIKTGYYFLLFIIVIPGTCYCWKRLATHYADSRFLRGAPLPDDDKLLPYTGPVKDDPLTRTVQNVYLFEKKVSHPARQLLQMQETKKDI